MGNIKGKTCRMIGNFYISSKRVLEIHLRTYEKAVKTYDHSYFIDMLLNWKFDLILLEYSSWLTAASKIHELGVTTPVIVLHPVMHAP